MTPKGHVVIATPTVTRPASAYIEAMERSIRLVRTAGWRDGAVYEIGNPYISAARSILIRKALNAGADVIVCIDHDVSWAPDDLRRLIETEGDVVAGTYRFKDKEERYMGAILAGEDGKPVHRPDGCIRADRIPAGFLKLTRGAIEKFARAHPELLYGPVLNPCVDIFNHGVIDRVWYGEDYAFSKRWRDMGEDIWIIPDLRIDHHSADEVFPGNFHEFLLRQPGGSADPVRLAA